MAIRVAYQTSRVCQIRPDRTLPPASCAPTRAAIKSRPGVVVRYLPKDTEAGASADGKHGAQRASSTLDPRQHALDTPHAIDDAHYVLETPEDLAPFEMQFYHLASQPLSSLKPRAEVCDGKPLGVHWKPDKVFWASPRSAWARWTYTEMPQFWFDNYTHLYALEVDLTHIFVLDGEEDLRALDKYLHGVHTAREFEGSEMQAGTLYWDALAADGYKGLLLTQRANKRYHSLTDGASGWHTWINAWDVCSLAVWDVTAIKGQPSLVASGEGLKALHDSFLPGSG